MSSQRTPLIAGNWKMNLDHLEAITLVQQLSWELRDAGYDPDKVEAAIFPPFTDLRSVQTLLDADKLSLKLGAQDVAVADAGAFTGDISGAFLKKLDCTYVIVGHSERRAGHHESDETVGQKAAAAVKHGMVPVICIGETAEDLEKHGAAAVPVQQLATAVAQLPEGAEFVVAYEPVWAIGSGKAATSEQAEEVCAALRAQLSEQLGAEVAERARVLYGGSVTSENIAGFMEQPNIDGALVGGASLKVAEFAKIINH